MCAVAGGQVQMAAGDHTLNLEANIEYAFTSMQLTVSLTTHSGTWTCQQATTAGFRRSCPIMNGYSPSTNLLYLLVYLHIVASHRLARSYLLQCSEL